MRSKTCPSCRAVVKHRPVPVFMIKSIVTVLKKINLKSPHASPPGDLHNNDLHTEDNPWEGIFASSEEEDDESPLESDSDGDVWYRHTVFEAVDEGNATTDSEMGNEEGEEGEEDDDENGDDGDDDHSDWYTHQLWAPPSVSITDYEAAVENDPDMLKLLQRGCSQGMLQSFDVSYSHRAGIIVALRSLDRLYASDDDNDDEDADDSNMHRVFLGWNIELQPDDMDGEEYMQQIIREIKDVPERWDVTIRVPFAMDARRLVSMDEAEEFEDTDTEAWISD